MTISGIFGVNNGDKVNSVIRWQYGAGPAISTGWIAMRITSNNGYMFPKYRQFAPKIEQMVKEDVNQLGSVKVPLVTVPTFIGMLSSALFSEYIVLRLGCFLWVFMFRTAPKILRGPPLL